MRFPDDPALVDHFARSAGLHPSGLRRLPSESRATFLLEGTGVVLKLYPPDVPTSSLETTLRAATSLAACGVPAVEPTGPVLSCEPFSATSWSFLRSTGPLEWESAGRSVRLLHDASLDLELPAALDPLLLASRLDSLATGGVLSAAEHALLSSWLPRLERTATSWSAAPPVLLHDDLWGKNLLQDGSRTVLLDLDSLCRGPREYDLAFLVRAQEAGILSPAELRSFTIGYGSPLPDLDAAWSLAYFHRFRWVVTLLSRRSWYPLAGELLAVELPRWARPDGPRP